MIRQAVILCGGKGTRLGSLTDDIPKPLLPVAGEVLLDRTIRLLARHGIKKALLMAGHLGEQIEEHYSAGSFEGVEVEVFIEPEPLGTAGAMPIVRDRLDDSFLLVYGDVFVDFDVSRLLQAHENAEDSCLATLLTRESDHPWDSHLVEVDDEGRVTEFVFEQEEGRNYYNRGNVAIYVCAAGLFDFIPAGCSSDFGRNVFPEVLRQNRQLRTLGLEPGGFVRDMGTPDRLTLVEKYLTRREKAEMARLYPRPPKVALLDRDGTLNKEVGLVSQPSQIEMIPGSAEAVARLCEAGWRCLVITNQPVIARGLCDFDTLNSINQVVVDAIRSTGGDIEKIYYSPYHPETQYGEGVKEFRRGSDCRKPGAGMIFQAAEECDLDLAECVMIGDSWRDIVAGNIAGLRTYFLGDVQDEPEGAEQTFPNLSSAVDHLINA